jgi:hypothetical protein
MVLTGGSLDGVQLVIFGLSTKIDSPLSVIRETARSWKILRNKSMETVSYLCDYASVGHVHWARMD